MDSTTVSICPGTTSVILNYGYEVVGSGPRCVVVMPGKDAGHSLRMTTGNNARQTLAEQLHN